MINSDGLIDMLQSFVKSVGLMNSHAGVVIFIDLTKILKLFNLLVALLDIPS